MSVQRGNRQPALIAGGTIGPGEEHVVERYDLPLDLDALVEEPEPGSAPRPWEVEIGFGKGRHLVSRAASDPERNFLGIEITSRYFRMCAERGRKRGLLNLLAIRGEARYLLATCLPRGFAEVVHVYFPDPWPKAKHHKRRLFDPESVDLLLDLLTPSGCLEFATDHLEYGGLVEEILRAHPGLRLETLESWPGGPRTNYEAKYVREGRPIRRLIAHLEGGEQLGPGSRVHPLGEQALYVAALGDKAAASSEETSA